MPHIVVAGILHPSGIDLLDQAAGITYDYIKDISEESYAPYMGTADGLIVRTQPLSVATVDKAPKLKIVSRHGVGYDAVAVDALNARNIPLAIVGDVNSRTVAEHAMTLILATSKRLLRYDEACRGKRDWNYRNSLEGREVYGKTLLIVGYGRIGKHLAGYAQAFGMKIVVYDTYLEKESLAEGIGFEKDFFEALKVADAISIHVPKSEKPILGAAEIAMLKPSAVVVNTARGGMVDEIALAEALEHDRLLGAGIDVFETEPPPSSHPLAGQERAILTPHSAGMTLECAERMATACVQNVIDYFNGVLDQALVVNSDEIQG